MNCFEYEPLLSVVISSYNRDSLLKKNLDKMLAVEEDSIEFVVGDNGSNDSTWDILSQYEDSRLHVYRNERNMGFENFWLLSELAHGRFFLFLNDRDYLDQYGIHDICRTLKDMKPCDFISCEWRKNRKGFYGHKDAWKIYFDSRHPGMLVYDRKFIAKVIDRNLLRKYLLEDKFAEANMYLVFQILKNVRRVYVHESEYINQPPNRERITKKRKEYYTEPYISLEYRKKELSDWFRYANELDDQREVCGILLAMFKDSLRTVTWEFYISMKIPGFKKRNSYENHRYEEWLLNGVIFTAYTLGECFKYHRGIKFKVLLAMIDNYFACLKNLMGS